ncbi:MAG: alpha/beta fold hydrolase [Proteobacteria bacterium]|nr:alpha/beta fold hydrolase [Pseudomonadota bacterium]MBI3497695.1 alpha/beta fold hydrolase [Pseudomonadota bacterium]
MVDKTGIQDIGDLRLASGAVLPQARLAYVTHGRLAGDGRNAALLTHGYTSSHLMAGAGASEGPWSQLVGPGRAIDTDRFFVVSSNMLGSSYGSTGPASRNPATGRPYGPDFPDITLIDIVTAQMALLRAFEVRHLAAVVGPSYGGFQAFQWAVTFPDFLDAIVPVVSAPRRPNETDIAGLQARLARDPNWNDGHYYEKGGILPTLAALREDTLRRYGIEAQLAPRMPDRATRNAEISRLALAWAREFDAHSLLVLGRAMNTYDVEPQFSRIRARVLYVLSRTDVLFPPSLAPEIMAKLSRAGVEADYCEIDSEHGHLASGTDAAKWAPRLKAFMDRLSVATSASA